ncbi:hypothetical protein AO889_03290 [Pseudomonas aeruginosa]|nr:hypothetical protein AO889_03290 [Pseudomonas aeruginosa]KSD07915.1 hypothetical protein AO890_03290 [Pseudomonas aeruginosa]KSH27388.1 hypothetical protein AO962_00735 [Pseudomonas aeruginosa]
MLIDRVEGYPHTFTDFRLMLEKDDAIAGPAFVVQQGLGCFDLVAGAIEGNRVAVACKYHLTVGDSADGLRFIWSARSYEVYTTMPTELMADRKGTLTAFLTQIEGAIIDCIRLLDISVLKEWKADDHRDIS